MNSGKRPGRPRRNEASLQKELHRLTLRLDAKTIDLLGCAHLVLRKSRQEIVVAAIGSFLRGTGGLSKADLARIGYHAKGVR